MLWTAIHDLKDSLNKAQRYGLVKKIAHGVHKDDPRCTPLQWVINQFGMEGDLKALGVTRVPDSLEAQGHTLSIAVATTLANLCAARHRVP